MADLLNTNTNNYGDDAIRTLTPREHVRLRPGMYIGKLGDGTQSDDGIYVLIKEVTDNSIDEYMNGYGHQIDITVEDNEVTVRDYGRGIPLNSLSAAVSVMNTGGKYDDDEEGAAFKKTVGLNGVGVKAVNYLSSTFSARSVRNGEAHTVYFEKGLEQSDRWESGLAEKDGTEIRFRVDEEVFGPYAYNLEYVEQLVRNYTPLQAFCIMLFCLLSVPCLATLAIIRREMNSWKMAVAEAGGLFVLAYLVTWIVFQLGSLLGIGTTSIG